ncbi:MlaC/ttg2D family ABC transporter substrate-binding protein [Neoroseomonas soli]|uniref:ABC transporter substrate-binding protein n=1 Tax=Neoroseomonas soli TaxID=1081025 RepID=A0A9X9WWM6_9PROT|nr:ABC transporter substrate-binding protein [Neoroseomonas soli]MBR0671555.1 ABC transporter substrate-binding protein [Neoroseomonas soli]
MTRRLLLSSPLLAAAVLMLPRRGRAEMDLTRATGFIQAAGNELVAAINDPRLGLPARRDKVAAVLRRTIDIEGTGRFILGRYVRQATQAEFAEYIRLFDDIIVRNLSARFGEYHGVRFSLGRSQQRTEEDALVNTIVERPNTAPFALDWRVSEIGGQPKVVDVIAEGTSLRLTTRSEYAAVIQRNGGKVAPLLEAMRNQIAQLAARETRG